MNKLRRLGVERINSYKETALALISLSSVGIFSHLVFQLTLEKLPSDHMFIDLWLAACAIALLVIFRSCGQRPKAPIPAIIILSLSLLLFSFLRPTLSTADSQVYYEIFSKIKLIDIFGKLATSSNYSLVSLDYSFPLFLKIIGPKIIVYFPGLVLFLNLTLWIISITHFLRSVKLTIGAWSDIPELHFRIYHGFFYASVSVAYWMGVFGKEITVIAMMMLAVSFLMRRSFLLASILLVLLTLLRPYGAGIALALYFFFTLKIKLLACMIILSITFLWFLTSFNLYALGNVPVMSGFMVLSPSPFSLENWSLYSSSRWVHSPVVFVLEGIFLFLLFGVATLFSLRSAERRKKLIAVIMVTVEVAIILLSVGAVRTPDMGFGDLGDNFVRKKVMYFPVLFFWCSLGLAFILTRLRFR